MWLQELDELLTRLDALDKEKEKERMETEKLISTKKEKLVSNKMPNSKVKIVPKTSGVKRKRKEETKDHQKPKAKKPRVMNKKDSS
jgi:hypothetical protein